MAFAGMLKFTGILSEFADLLEEIKLGLYDAGDLAVIRLQKEGILHKLEKKWAAASSMR